MGLDEQHRLSIESREGSGGRRRGHRLAERPRRCSTTDAPFYRWFPDGALNTCFNALDRHVDARPRRPGRAHLRLAGDRHAARPSRTRELRDEVARLRRRAAGARASSRATASSSTCRWCPRRSSPCWPARGSAPSTRSCSAGSPRTSWRPASTTPGRRSIVVGVVRHRADRIIEYKPLLDAALDDSAAQARALRRSSSATAGRGRARSAAATSTGHDAGRRRRARPTASPVAATDPLYILYTSGTTGKPKGVVRDNGGHAVALRWTMRNVYDVHPGEVFWAASDVGWVVGHSYIVYAPLLTGCTTILYEGKPVGTPDPGRVLAGDRRARRRRRCSPRRPRSAPSRRRIPTATHLARYDLSRFRTLFLAGERLDPDTLPLGGRAARRPGHRPLVADRDRLADRRQLPRASSRCRSSPARRRVPVPGLRRQGPRPETATEVPPGQTRAPSAVKLPLPPGTLPTLWNDDDRFVASYLSAFPGYYLTGDGGYLDEDGYLYVMGRIDDVINVAGHRLSTGRSRRSSPRIPTCRVRGHRRRRRAKGQVPLGFVVLKAGVDARAGRDRGRARRQRARRVGAVAALREVRVFATLPTTRASRKHANAPTSARTLATSSRSISSGSRGPLRPSARRTRRHLPSHLVRRRRSRRTRRRRGGSRAPPPSSPSRAGGRRR